MFKNTFISVCLYTLSFYSAATTHAYRNLQLFSNKFDSEEEEIIFNNLEFLQLWVCLSCSRIADVMVSFHADLLVSLCCSALCTHIVCANQLPVISGYLCGTQISACDVIPAVHTSPTCLAFLTFANFVYQGSFHVIWTKNWTKEDTSAASHSTPSINFNH